MHICRHVILRFGTRPGLLLEAVPKKYKKRKLDLRGYCRVIQVSRLVKERRGREGKKSKGKDRKVPRRV